MHLSKLLLSGDKFRNPYEIHRALWAAFPESPDKNRDFLFRIDQQSPRNLQVLLQSAREPSEQSEQLKILASKSFEPVLLVGTQLRFMLLANPVKTIRDDQGRENNRGEIKKCRVPLIKEDDLLKWLGRKFDGIASITSPEVEKQSPVLFRKGKRPGKIQPCLYKGVLQVNDSALLRELLESGVGPGKAFGCGLLSLARA